jgi:hypothetical protein
MARMTVTRSSGARATSETIGSEIVDATTIPAAQSRSRIRSAGMPDF